MKSQNTFRNLKGFKFSQSFVGQKVSLYHNKLKNQVVLISFFRFIIFWNWRLGFKCNIIHTVRICLAGIHTHNEIAKFSSTVRALDLNCWIMEGINNTYGEHSFSNCFNSVPTYAYKCLKYDRRRGAKLCSLWVVYFRVQSTIQLIWFCAG